MTIYSNGKITFTQSHERGITRTIAGIISAIGNIFSLTIRKPVASIKKPPQALKSAIISGVVNGTMKDDRKKRQQKIINCGTATNETTYPKLQAKIAAVKKSKIDLEIRIVESPVIPESKLS